MAGVVSFIPAVSRATSLRWFHATRIAPSLSYVFTQLSTIRPKENFSLPTATSLFYAIPKATCLRTTVGWQPRRRDREYPISVFYVADAVSSRRSAGQSDLSLETTSVGSESSGCCHVLLKFGGDTLTSINAAFSSSTMASAAISTEVCESQDSSETSVSENVSVSSSPFTFGEKPP